MRSLITGVAAVAAVIAIGAAAGCSSSQTGNDGPSSPPVTSGVDPTPSPTTTLTDAQRVAQWYAGVQAHFNSIQSDTEAIKVAAQNSKVSALPALCGELRANVVQVNSDPAPPNKLMAVAVASAMASYGSAATSCLAGDYNAAATGINKGAAYLAQANAVMGNLS